MLWKPFKIKDDRAGNKNKQQKNMFEQDRLTLLASKDLLSNVMRRQN